MNAHWLVSHGRILLACLTIVGSAGAVNVEDTLSRPDSTDLGLTEIGMFPYLEAGTTTGITDVAEIVSEELRLFGTDGVLGSGPGLALIDAALADVNIAADMRFTYPNGQVNSSSYNVGGFMLRRPGTEPGFGAANEGQIEVTMHAGGALFIREIAGGSLNTLFFENPFGGSGDNNYSAAGQLPALVGGLPFDVNENGVLEDSEQFRLAANLVGDDLTVTINGEPVANVTTSSAVPSSSTSLSGFYKNRWTGGGTRDVLNPVYDNLVVSGTEPLPPPPPPTIVHVGDTNPLDEAWVAFNGGALIANNGPVDDGGTPAWNVHDDSSVGGSREAYTRSLTPEQVDAANANGWSMQAALRFVGIDDPADGAVELSAYVDSQIGFVLWFGADSLGDPVVGELTGSQSGGDIGLGRTATISGEGYHDYEMKYDPATQTVDVFADDQEVISDYAGVNLDQITPLNRVLWGSNDSSGMGNANYSFVEFSIVPEPSSLALLGVGLVGLLSFGRRSRRSTR